MDVIVAENCTNKSEFEKICQTIQSYLKVFLKNYELDSLKYFVIADSEPSKYFETLELYAEMLHTDKACNDSEMYQVAGKVIEGIDDAGNYRQVVVVKSALILGMLEDIKSLENVCYISQIPNYPSLRWLGLTTILHELGHVVDNEHLATRNLRVCLKNGYDLSNKSELEEYFLYSAVSLWSEFFAESFLYLICPALRPLNCSKTDELLNCIENFRTPDVSAIDRIFQILYLFVHTIAHDGQGNFDYNILNNYRKYIPSLQIIESEMFRILGNYSELNVQEDFSKIKKTFYRLCVLESQSGS